MVANLARWAGNWLFAICKKNYTNNTNNKAVGAAESGSSPRNTIETLQAT